MMTLNVKEGGESRMRSKARRVIDRSVAMGHSATKVYLADGQVFMYPSDSGGTHHIVARLERHTAKRVYEEWVCSCRGFWFSQEDRCWHITDLQDQYVQARNNLRRRVDESRR